MKKIIIILLICFIKLSIHAQSSLASIILNKGGSSASVALPQDYDNDGDIDIIVLEEDPAKILWLENEISQQFPRRTVLEQDVLRPKDIDVADFDKDGKADYLICMASTFNNNDGQLAWFQRQTNNTYIKWTIEANGDFNQAEVADFDKDGDLDIVAVGFEQSSVNMYINEGNFNFKKTIIYQGARGLQVRDVVTDDIDKDGDIDVLFGEGIDDNKLLINNGKGSFSDFGKLTNSNFFNPLWVDAVIADIDNDGQKDILTWNNYGTPELTLMKGPGFLERVEIDDLERGNGGELLVADFDKNGFLDIVVQSYSTNTVYILYQSARLQFRKEILDAHWNNSSVTIGGQMAAVDLDKDGDLDILFPEDGNVDYDLSIFENINGKFAKRYLYAQMYGARTPKFADLDNDKDVDLIVTIGENSPREENEIIKFENIGDGKFLMYRISDLLDYPTDIELADIDKDGDLDIFATARNSNDLVWLRNDGNKLDWPSFIIEENANTPLGIATGDIDGDGNIDVALCSNGDAKLFWYKGDGKGGFSRRVIDPNLLNPREIKLVDFDKDGDLDAAVICSNVANTVTLYINENATTWTRKILYTQRIGFDIEVGDLNKDGFPDLGAVFSAGSTSPNTGAIIWSGDGKGNFTILQGITTTNSVDMTAIKFADVESDGDLDVLYNYSNFSDERIMFSFENNNGELAQNSTRTTEYTGSQSLGLDAVDLDGDGLLEVVFTDFNRGNIVFNKYNCFFTKGNPRISATPICGGVGRGALEVVLDTGVSGATYRWGNGTTTKQISNLVQGNYDVTVTDQKGCAVKLTGSVVSANPPAIRLRVINPKCFGGEDGLISALVSGSSAPFVYTWNNGKRVVNLDSLKAGMYTITVTDAKNCQSTASITVVNPPELALKIAVMPSQDTLKNGMATATPSGGTAPYKFNWSNGATTSAIANLPSGSYTITVSDANDCKKEGTVTIGKTTPTKELLNLLTAKVYPNPFNETLFIQVEQFNSLSDTAIKLYDALGREQILGKMHQSQNGWRFHLEHLPQGIYFLSMTYQNEVIRSFNLIKK